MIENQLLLENRTKMIREFNNVVRTVKIDEFKDNPFEPNGEELFAIHTRDVMNSKVSQGSSCSSGRGLCAVLVTRASSGIVILKSFSGMKISRGHLRFH